jgi:antitoxin HicB
MLAYPIRLTKDDNGTFLVTCGAFPEVTTFGENEGEAFDRALDAIEEAIAARMADREPIPAPSRGGKRRVVLPAQTVAKVLLYQAMLAEHVSKNQLARSLKWHRPQVDRLLNLRHSTKMNAIETAFHALGKQVRIEIEEAN